LRNWRPGDRFWPPHSKAPKKVKELLQARHIPGEQRRGWPVIASEGDLVWMRGFPVPEHAQPSSHEAEAILIQEAPLPAAHSRGPVPR
jgi:tRNA(Ile)-lysidine synthetase-like protein